MFFSYQVLNIISPRLDRVALAVACEVLKLEKLCDQDFRFLSEYATVIKPIAEAITFLEGDIKTFGAYLPKLFDVREQLKELSTSDELLYCQPLLAAVKDGFQRRFSHLMHLTDIYERGSPKAVGGTALFLGN